MLAGSRRRPTLRRVDDTFPVADGITAIDTRMVGRYLVTSAYLVEAEEPALIETGPTTSADAVARGLDALGMTADQLAHIVVTHIHLDHAGGAGTLARRYPAATIWVHGRGAPHLADPTRLVASTARTYGPDRMREFFGDVLPIPSDRLRTMADGDRVRFGNRSVGVLETPGHASHHVCLVDSLTGALFAGDALGVHLPDVRVLRPATPPPEFDIELACASIDRIAERAPAMLLLSHFGPVENPSAICSLAIERIRRWGEIVRLALEADDDVERISALLEAQGGREYLEDSGQPIDMERYDVLSSVRMNAAGLIRYWSKRAEAEALGALSSESPEHRPSGPAGR
jgi:glyoxylase-like metal-dependent hydrolase (beta-lactamase superfamily II)